MSDTSNVLKAPAGGSYERGWCEPDPQGPKQCVDKSIRVPQKPQKKPARNDRFVRGLNPLISKKMQKLMRNPAWQALQVAQLSAAFKKQAWYEEVVSNLMSAERWKALPGNLLRAPGMLGAAVVAAFGAGCVYDTSGLAAPDGTVQPDVARHDAGDAEVTDDGAVDGATDGTTPVDGSPDTGADADAEVVVVDDRPTITWPSLNTLPNNRAFVRWNPPSETEPGKTVVGYQVSWSDGSNNYNKEVTFPFTAIDILSPNTMHSITVRARYNDASYGQSSTQAQVIADTSLMARYTMDEGAGTMIMDDSGNGNHGTLVGFDPLTAWTQGISGTALLFDGVDSYVDTGNAFNFDSTDAFTIDAWVQRSSGGLANSIFVKMDRVDTIVRRGYALTFMNTDELYFTMVSHNGNLDKMQIYTTNQFSFPNSQYHVAGVYDGSMLAAGASIYVDGAVQQSIVVLHDSLAGTILNGAPGRTGAAIVLGGPVQVPEYVMDGKIDDLTIYSRALTPDEIVNNTCAREALNREENSDTTPLLAVCN